MHQSAGCGADATAPPALPAPGAMVRGADARRAGSRRSPPVAWGGVRWSRPAQVPPVVVVVVVVVPAVTVTDMLSGGITPRSVAPVSWNPYTPGSAVGSAVMVSVTVPSAVVVR